MDSDGEEEYGCEACEMNCSDITKTRFWYLEINGVSHRSIIGQKEAYNFTAGIQPVYTSTSHQFQPLLAESSGRRPQKQRLAIRPRDKKGKFIFKDGDEDYESETCESGCPDIMKTEFWCFECGGRGKDGKCKGPYRIFPAKAQEFAGSGKGCYCQDDLEGWGTKCGRSTGARKRRERRLEERRSAKAEAEAEKGEYG
ncbi:hypothetical protein GQ43DRAFT_435412 [Delitschia confertaspora ATCC 74209]|uniref:Uncharacterized protein n=1 Tax=Delitschia confertaspora ATCC 74209 TaxID=1513339 RepID=A0A9P4JIJ4_9PLEO|nr:hypothetical protein GQ43DRAFT_435412 [Delitschia confertaspora ATCC 74209]